MKYRGPVVGTHMGRPIFESLEEQDNIYIFDRLAHCDADECSLDELKDNEIFVQPGLIYRQAS